MYGVKENTLGRLGFTTDECRRLNQLSFNERQQELRQGLEAYVNEVLSDEPVSILYHYWLDTRNNLYSHPSFETKHLAVTQIDPRERGGTPAIGLQKVGQLLARHPNKVVLWYSPIGPAAFDGNLHSPFSQINYDYGQLYIQYNDGEKINAIAIKVTNEEVLRQFSTEIYALIQKLGLKEKVFACMTNPLVLNEDINQFFDKRWQNEAIYKDKKGKVHFLHDVIEEARKVFAGIKKPIINLYKHIIETNIKSRLDRDSIFRVYTSTIQQYMFINGLITMSLSGSCGGSSVNRFDFEDMFGIKSIINNASLIGKLSNIYSSLYRLTTQGHSIFGLSKDAEFVCPNCHQASDGPVGNTCPKCGITKEKAKKKGLVTC